MATMWMVSLTRVNSDDVTGYYYASLTSGSASSGCEMTLQAYPAVLNGDSLHVTMTTKYNETFIDGTNFTFDSTMLYRSYWNFSQVHRLMADSTNHMQILPDQGDPMYISSTHPPTTDFLLLTDDQDGGQRVYLVGMRDNTAVSVYTTNDSSDQLELVHSMQINNYEKVLLNSSFTRDGVRVNSSQTIGVIMVSRDGGSTCNASSDVTWERLPDSSFMGKEFHILSHSNDSVLLCKLLGEQTGNISIHTEDNSTVHTILPLTSITANLTGKQEVVVTSDVPIQIMCTTWVQQPITNVQRMYRNQYFLSSAERLSWCNLAVIQNCLDETCILAMSEASSNILDIQLTGKYNKFAVTADRTSMVANRTFHIWSIGNLTNGVYMIQTRDRVAVVVYVLDVRAARFFPLESLTDSACDVAVSSVTGGATNVTGGAANAMAASTSAASDAVSTSPTMSVTADSNHSLVTSTSGANANDTSNNSSSSSTSSAPNVTASTPPNIKHVAVYKYAFMYHEIPEDNKILNEYMIAVIVSLATAIFAVIAVLATFLLLEVLAKRRRLGNSKIRPMLS